MNEIVKASSNTRPLLLGTLSFAVGFAAWGLISAFAPRFREMFHLTGTQSALLVAVPVLLGSLGRLPVGMIADRFGGRIVFSKVPAFPLSLRANYLRLAGLGHGFPFAK